MIDAKAVINKIKDDRYYTHEELTIVLNYIDKLEEENKELQIQLGKYQYDTVQAFSDDFIFYPKNELDITEELKKAIKNIRNDINLAIGAEGFESEVLCDKDDLTVVLNATEELQVKLQLGGINE